MHEKLVRAQHNKLAIARKESKKPFYHIGFFFVSPVVCNLMNTKKIEFLHQEFRGGGALHGGKLILHQQVVV